MAWAVKTEGLADFKYIRYNETDEALRRKHATASLAPAFTE